eukprot:TRINITY_DN151_c0_g2_i1.p1 TRINITY_DN151_c0_g2~~TRINITY_DN151_c0_g2_i1.p1  ORF type:complete len:598 (+),score=114.90 TRINITY_DN151_c0_g2_i1:198-1991(+)
MMNSIVVPNNLTRAKVQFNDDIRVVSIDSPVSFRALVARIGELYQLNPAQLLLRYKDSEGDVITIATHQDLVEAVTQPSLRITIELRTTPSGSERGVPSDSATSSPAFPVQAVKTHLTHENVVSPIEVSGGGDISRPRAGEAPGQSDSGLLQDELKQEWRESLADKKRAKFDRREAKREAKEVRRNADGSAKTSTSDVSGNKQSKKDKKKARKSEKKVLKEQKRDIKVGEKKEKHAGKKARKAKRRAEKDERRFAKVHLNASPVAQAGSVRSTENCVAPNDKKAVKLQRRAAKLERWQRKQEKLASRSLSARLVRNLDAPKSIDTHVAQHANAQFVKTWRLRNDGRAAWPAHCYLAFVATKHSTESDRMGGPQKVVVPVPVAPGQEVELGVPLTAPAQPGRYVGNWMMHSPSGYSFGQSFTVKLFVSPPSPKSSNASGENTTSNSLVYRDPYLRDDPYLSHEALVKLSTPSGSQIEAEVNTLVESCGQPTINSMLRELRSMGYTNTGYVLHVLQQHDMQFEDALATLKLHPTPASVQSADNDDSSDETSSDDDDDDDDSSDDSSYSGNDSDHDFVALPKPGLTSACSATGDSSAQLN